MNKHESEFQDLIEQLGRERPSAPEPNHAFTTDLRGQLLEQYEQGAGWRISFSNLMSAATALAVLALVVLVGWFLNSSQQQPTVVGEVIQTTRVAETGDPNKFERILFGKDIQLVNFALLPNPAESDSGTVQFVVDWQSANRITDNDFSSYGGWLRIVNEQGELVSEVIGGLEWQPFNEGSQAQMKWTDQLPNGRYQIYAGIYDQTTLKNLLSEEGDEFVLLDTLTIAPSTSIVTHSTLQVSRFVDETYTWNATVEHWQTADGRLNRTLVVDEDGQLDHFAQNDGTRLYIGNTLNPIYSPNRRLQSYFQLNDTAPNRTAAEQAGKPPFYSDLGWDSLADLLVSSELDCSTYECIQQMVKPALVSSDLQRNEAYGWGSSLIATVEENGRTVHIFHIAYNDGLSSEAFPQYRQVKTDANSLEVVSIQDYDGETLLRSVELISREQVNLPLREFQIVPEIVEQTVMNGYGGIVNFGDIQFSGYGWSVWPTIGSPNPLVFNIFWQADEVPDNELTSFVHIFDESGGLVFQNDTVLQWDAPTQAGERFTAHFSLEKQLSHGRHQVQVGVYDTITGQRLTTDEGETAVQVDEIIIDK